WMNSPGHRANILNCKSKTVGVGVAYAANGTPYYTQDFGY
ncbi:CAP domain-containing protein, partial [Actinoplanes hulinensis]